MILDGAGELIVDVLTANRSLSSIPSASAILDTSNYTFHAITYGKDAAGFKQHAHILRYDTSGFSVTKQQVVIFGGDTSSLELQNKFYDISTVYVSSTSASITKPVARKFHDIVYDSTRGKLVLFGGTSGGVTYCSDTWEASATVTTPSSYVWELKTTSGPGPRSGHSMAYFEKGGYTLLFGGRTVNNTYTNETWKWDGTSWTQLILPTNPQARADHRIVYNPNKQKIILFGGTSNTRTVMNDLWEYDGINWELKIDNGEQIQTGNGYFQRPSGRRLFGMTYCSGTVDGTLRYGTLMYGGLTSSVTNPVNDQLWFYENDWYTLTAGPKLYGHTLVYNPNQNYSIIYGGASSLETSSTRNSVYKIDDTLITFTNYTTDNITGSGLFGHAACYYKDTTLSNTYISNDKIIKTLSYENNVKSYHTSATASALAEIYNLLPTSPTPLDRRLELNSTVPNYYSGVPDVGHCLNSIIDPNLSAYANFIGCFPASGGTKYWLVSSADYSLTAASGTLSSLYNQLSVMDSSGFLKFAEGYAATHNTLYNNTPPAPYLYGAIRPALASLSFPNKVSIKWALPPGDAGGLLLFGGIYQLGLWYLDLKEMLKQGYSPPYDFKTLNNVRKHKLFAKKTFNKDLLYMKDTTGGISAFNYYCADGINYIYFTWELLMV